MMLAGTAVAAMADDSSVIRLALRNTGVDSDAAGNVLSVLKSKSSVVSLNATKLTPGQSYTVTVGETPEATLVADKNGRLIATFSTKPKKNKPTDGCSDIPLPPSAKRQLIEAHNGELRAKHGLSAEPAAEDRRRGPRARVGVTAGPDGAGLQLHMGF